MALSRSRVAAAVGRIVALAIGVGSAALRAPEADTRVSVSALTPLDGAVLTRHGGADFAPAHEGDVLVAGDTIRTGRRGAAVTTYFDGSSVLLGAETEIVVESLRPPEGGAAQTFGRAWRVITTLFSRGSRYAVRGPSATASVRG